MKRPLGNLAPRYAPAILGALLLAGCTSQSAEAPTAAVEPAAAAAAEKQEKQEQREQAPARTVAPFTILVMGDNRGEIVPCGCKDFPRGGLPRRATFVQEARAAGPVLLLDAGDALFEDPYRKSAYAKAKAELVMKGMGRLETAAMAVGDRDLTEGVEWLQAQAKAAGIPLLSANLRTEEGVQPFQSHRIFQVGEARVGVVGLFGMRAGMRMPTGLVMEDPVEAARASVAAMQAEGVDVIVALVHGPNDVIRAVAAVPGVEMIVPSHDGSISFPYRPNPDAAWIIAGGQMGRTLTSVRFHLEGGGRLEDAGAAAPLKEDRASVAKNLDLAKVRFERADPGAPERESLAEQIRFLERRDVDLAKRIAALDEIEGRHFESKQHSLGDDIADEPEMAALLKAFEDANPTP